VLNLKHILKVYKEGSWSTINY